MPVSTIAFRAALEAALTEGTEAQAREVETALIGREPLGENGVEVLLVKGGTVHLFRGAVIELSYEHSSGPRGMKLSLSMEVDKEGHKPR